MLTLHIKRGDTLKLPCTVQDAGVAVDITGWHIQCWLRSAGGQLVHQFTPQVTDAPAGQYHLAATAQETSLWPVGPLSADIRYTDAQGTVQHTETWQLRVAQAISAP